MTTNINEYRAGMTAGVRTEFLAIGDIIPGHAEALRQLHAADANNPGIPDAINEIGTLHEARFVLLDDDTRLMFASSFDGPFDVYIDDFARTTIGQTFDANWQHVQGYPGIQDPGIKRWLKDHTYPAGSYFAAYPEPTVRQIWKMQAVQAAFQKVLDDPAAAEALQHPALKPLLEQAAA